MNGAYRDIYRQREIKKIQTTRSRPPEIILKRDIYDGRSKGDQPCETTFLVII